MELNVERDFAKYSKFGNGDNSLNDNETVFIMSQNEKTTEKKWSSNDESTDNQKVKIGNLEAIQKLEIEFLKRWKIGPKTLAGVFLVVLMMISGLIAGLFIMDMENQRLKLQIQDDKAQNQDLLHAQNISQAQIDNLILQNKNQTSKYKMASNYLQKILKNNSNLLHETVTNGNAEEVKLFLDIGAHNAMITNEIV